MSSPQKYVCEERVEREINRIEYELTVDVDVATDQQRDDSPGCQQKIDRPQRLEVLHQPRHQCDCGSDKEGETEAFDSQPEFQEKNVTMALPCDTSTRTQGRS